MTAAMTRSPMPRRALRGCALLLVAATVAVPATRAQSERCTTIDGTSRSCEDGFTCAQNFGGGDRFERFTMTVVSSQNPLAPLSILVDPDGTGQAFVTVWEGTAEQGLRFGWTVLEDAEGDSFVRVDNRIGTAPIVIGYACDRADTSLDEPVDAGDQQLPVVSTAPFSVGDSIVVAPGGPDEEHHVVAALGARVRAQPLQLQEPLQSAHAAGTFVVSRSPAADAPTATDARPETAAFALAVHPNPVAGTAAVTLARTQAGSVDAAVYDALGRRVAVLHEGPLPAGPHTLGLDVAGWAPGHYVVRVRAEGAAHAARFTVVR